MQCSPLRPALCALAMLLAAAGCETSDSAPSATPDKAVEKATTPPKNMSAKKPAKPATKAEIETIICKGHLSCRTKQIWDAGLDADKQPMQVVEITTDAKLTDILKKNVSYFHENRDVEPCEPLEYWFVRPTLLHDKTAEPALLTRACGGSDPNSVTDGDQVTVEPGRFVFSTASGSGVIDSAETSVALPSLQIIARTEGSWARNRTDFYSHTWNWQEMAGRKTGFDPHCENETGEYDADNFDTPNFDYQPIILAPLPAAFRSSGWKTTSLDSCSTSVTSLGDAPPTLDRGYVTHGKPGTAQDASFKIVMASPTELYVEVRDPRLVREAKNILHSDHLELWIRDGFLCNKSYKNLFQWGITLDGKVHPFYGKHPKPPTVETHLIPTQNGAQIARFKITIPEKYDGLTVVYSDSDDGKSQKRLIATSNVKYRDQFSIGALKDVSPERGGCQEKNTKLEYMPKLQKPKNPVISPG